MAISSVNPVDPRLQDAKAESGLLVFRASRLEALIPPLWSLADASWPANILAPQTIIAAHSGMKQWLTGELARHNGSAGISANLDIILPSAWLERLAQAELGHGAISLSSYQTAHLRWTLHAMLAPGQPVPGVSDPRVAAYLSPAAGTDAVRNAELARRRFQLADRLARIYSQYLVYRPDWLQAWEGGQFAFASGAASAGGLSGMEAELLGPLWKQLAARLGRHRGHAMQALCAALGKNASPRPTVHVFGISHLAPNEIDVLRAYAGSGLVALYVPDPCREYWGGLIKGVSPEWQAYRVDENARISAAGEGDYWQEQGHPLLARWGRMGQHFFSSLADGDVLEDTRHRQDEQPDTPDSRLHRLQESIRQLKPAVMDVDIGVPEIRRAERADVSLRIHACHTRQRELEVLREVLIDALQQGIAPGEMMVMAPDIQAYLPLIASVFGEPGAGREQLLPYHLADVPVARSHSLFSTVQRLLELPGQRVTAPEVLDMLSVPEIRQRLGLDEGAIESLAEWLRQSRVAWALDARHRAGFGVPPIPEHSFAWAMDRMIAGYLMSDAPDADRDRAFSLPDGTEFAPVTGINGPSADALGALDRLLLEIQAWCDFAESDHTASEWAELLDRRLEALFRIDPMDRDAREAWDALKRFVRALELEPAGAGQNPVLHFAVVRDLLVDRLATVPERQRFLMGGVTFCGMVPQRAIPFRMLAVLGLNDGEFPRSGSDGSLDLMTRIRRLGDRDVRNDDRYLFLETVMAARDRLHLSYLGEGVKDGKPRNPAAPLAELMAQLDAAANLGHDAKDGLRPWLVRHPLQPFDGRYFDGSDQRLFSYSKRFEAMQGAGSEPPKAFLQGSSGEPDPLPNPLALSLLQSYFKDPARNVLEKRLKLRLDALDDSRLPADEPLDDSIDSLATVSRSVFFQDVLPAWGAWQPEVVPAWVRLTGLLPPGAQGVLAWTREVEAIEQAMTAAKRSQTLTAEVAARAREEPLDVEIGQNGFPELGLGRITGRVRHVFPLLTGDGEGLQIVRMFPSLSGASGNLKAESDLHFGDRVAIFLDWALLRLQAARNGRPLGPVRVTLLVKDNDAPWQDSIARWDGRLMAADAAGRQSMLDDLQSRIVRLVQWWREAQRLPHWYFPRTSWAAASLSEQARQSGDWRSIQGKWSGFDSSGERAFAPGYNALLAGDVMFDQHPPELDRLMEFAAALHETLFFEQDAGQ